MFPFQLPLMGLLPLLQVFFCNCCPLISKVSNMLQVAVKNNAGQIYYFTMKIPLSAVCTEAGLIDQASYLNMWRSIPDNTEQVREAALSSRELGLLSAKLKASNIFEIARLKMAENVSLGFPFSPNLLRI